MVSVSVVLLIAGCGGSAFYDNSRNWVIRNNEIPAYSSDYDVFYLYPSQMVHTSGPTLNWFQEGLTETIRHYASVMTSDLAKYHVRIFSPFIPQLGFDSYSKLMEERNKSPENFAYRKSGLEPAIRHTVMALKYYLKHYNPGGGRPYVIIGQGQGAVVLYEAMKEVADVTPAKGFAAAYFQGLPGVTAETIHQDFHFHGIVPASGRYDFGVIVLFNTGNLMEMGWLEEYIDQAVIYIGYEQYGRIVYPESSYLSDEEYNASLSLAVDIADFLTRENATYAVEAERMYLRGWGDGSSADYAAELAVGFLFSESYGRLGLEYNGMILPLILYENAGLYGSSIKPRTSPFACVTVEISTKGGTGYYDNARRNHMGEYNNCGWADMLYHLMRYADENLAR